MADTKTTTDTDVQPEPAERTVPYSRFKEINDKLAAERQERDALVDRLEQLENRDKTDVERLTKERERLEKRATEAEQRANELEAKSVRDGKASLITAAAAKLNFHDPALAAQLLSVDDVEDAAAAERAVKSLAKDRSYLVRSEPAESAKLRKVGVDGQVIDDAKDKGLITMEEQNRRFGEELFGVLSGPNTGAGSGLAGE